MKILITDPMPPELIAELRRRGLEVVQVKSPPINALREIIKGYDAVIVRSATRITAEVIESADRLKVIARAGAGLDNIDVEAAARRNIKVINVPEAVANAVAELTVGLAFSLLRSIPQAAESMKSGRWEKGAFIGRELSGMRVGVVGLGSIGSLVARKLVALGAQVVVFRRNRELLVREAASIGAQPAASLEELLRTCELVTLHIPYTAETHHLLNESNLRLMPKGSYLINTSRAWVVDGKALLRALNDGTLQGVATDVHYNEPPQEDWEWQLIRHPSVIPTPHIGAQTREASARVSQMLLDKLLKALGEEQGSSEREL